MYTPLAVTATHGRTAGVRSRRQVPPRSAKPAKSSLQCLGESPAGLMKQGEGPSVQFGAGGLA